MAREKEKKKNLLILENNSLNDEKLNSYISCDYVHLQIAIFMKRQKS